MNFVNRTAWILSFVCMAACRSTGTESPAGVRAAVERIVAADNARDLDAAVACYAADAEWLPPQEPPVVGREAVRARYASMFATFQPKIVLTIEEAWVMPELAVVRGLTRGSLVPLDGGPERVLDDKYLMLLRRDADGVWRILRLMWSPNRHG